MQGEVDNLQSELKRKEGDIGIMNTEKDRLLNRMKVEEGNIKGFLYGLSLPIYYWYFPLTDINVTVYVDNFGG